MQQQAPEVFLVIRLFVNRFAVTRKNGQADTLQDIQGIYIINVLNVFNVLSVFSDLLQNIAFLRCLFNLFSQQNTTGSSGLPGTIR